MLVFCLIVCFMVVLVIIIKVIRYPKQEVAMSINPIDGITPNGVMGFNIGDSYAFCLSRFSHLNLQIDSSDLVRGNECGFVVFGRGMYNNINEVRCRFEQGHLYSVTIDIDYSKDGIRDMYGILKSRLCRILRKEPSYEERNRAMWAFSNTEVRLFRHIVPIIEEERLLVQVTFA